MEEVKLSNSFWFNSDEDVNTQDKDSSVSYEIPSHRPVAMFDFENYQTADSIYFTVTGFISSELVNANGIYNKTSNKLNNEIVYTNNNGWFIFNENSYWVLANNIEATNNDLSDFEYTTSESSKTPRRFNGNFGSSELFNNEVGIVEIDFIYKTPTPTPSPTQTPTPTPSPTYKENDEGIDSPSTPIPAFTPTPTPTQTPTPFIDTLSTPTPTPSDLGEESVLLVKYGEFGITKKYYDMSSNPRQTEQEIINDFSKQGIEIEGILELEELMSVDIYSTDFLVSIINLDNINIKIRNYERLVSSELKSNKLSKYGWDSSGVLSIGSFRSFYLSQTGRGRLHDYNNQQPLQDTLGMSIKSWIGARPCFVKIKSDVETITSFSVSNGRHDGINIKWNPAKNSNYVKIENSSDGINWTTLVDNLSNSSSDGYLDKISPRGQLIYYRIVSYGNMESETTSLVKSGWRLGFPDAPTNVKASRNYTNRIHVTWDSPTSQNDYSKLESYSIYRSKLLDENNRPLPRSFTTFEKIASNITETSFMDIGEIGESLQHDVAYFYIIESNNESTSFVTDEEYQELNTSSLPNQTAGGLRGLNIPDFNYIVDE